MSYYQSRSMTIFLTTLIFFSILSNIIFWQFNRQALKTLEDLKLEPHHARTITLANLINNKVEEENLNNYQFEAFGKFDSTHYILFTPQRNSSTQSGYEVYMPFYIFGSDKIILVDRGFFPMTFEKNKLPDIQPIFGEQTIHGKLLLSSSLPSLNQIKRSDFHFPLITSIIDTKVLSQLLNHPLYPYILQQD